MLFKAKLPISAIVMFAITTVCLNLSAVTAHSHPMLRAAGNKLIAGQPVDEKKLPTVAILLFDHVEIIDFAGPWEVFGGAGYKVFTVAEKLDPVNTVYGQKIVADYTFDNSPKADVLLVPGGGVGGAVANAKLIDWVKKREEFDLRDVGLHRSFHPGKG